MKWNHIVVLSLFLNFLVSCTPKQQETENKTIFIPLVEKKVLPVTDIFEEVKYIPLETNDFSLLTSITDPLFSKLILKNGYIYTQHLNSPIFIFDETGKWIRTIDRKGQGPEEYLNIRSFDVNNNREIAVLELKRIIFYSCEGKFLTSVTHPGYGRIAHYLNDTLLIFCGYPISIEGYKLHILDKNTLEFVNSYWPIHLRQYSVSSNNYAVDYQGHFIFYEPQSPHIYELSADSATLRYSMNIGNKMPPENFWNVKDMTWDEIVEKNIGLRLRQEHQDKGYIDHIMFFSESQKTILFQFSGTNNIFDGTYALVNKKSRSSILIDKIAFDSQLVWKPRTMFSRSDGIVIIPIPADIVLESGEGEIRKMFPDLLEDDNPILCIAKLR